MEVRKPEAIPNATLQAIKESFESALSERPAAETERTLTYVNYMKSSDFTGGGIWSAKLRKAIDDGLVIVETSPATLDDLNDSQENIATHPNNSQIFFKHVISLA